MPQETIKQILMRRDALSNNEADKMIDKAREELMLLITSGRFMEADNICYAHFNLEPDYLMDLI